MEQIQVNRRLASLDALRGFDMFWIIGGDWIFRGLDTLLHSGGESWISRQLDHVPWEGFRFWDLIMPLFLFIVGTAMPYSFAKRLESRGRARLTSHIVKRVAVLFVLGMIAQGHLLSFDPDKIHLLSNTLQAIAFGYLGAAVIYLNFKLKAQVALTSGLLFLYWALMSWVPVPGHGAGSLTPEGNLAIFIDRALQGSMQDGTTYSWILSALAFTGTVMLGVWAGGLLRSGLSAGRKFSGLLAYGAACLVLGLLWSLVFPIIKHLWTSSFVLFSGGLCILLLAVFYFLLDLRGWRSWAFPFRVIGMNAIAVYMATRLFDFRIFGDIFVGGLMPYVGHAYPLVRGLAGFTVIWLILFWMYRTKSFVKI